MHGVSPLPLRRKLWLMHNQMVRAQCDRHGITFLDVPQSMLRPDGALVLYAGLDDPVHGNVHYGVAMLDQISDSMTAAA
jgi:hypothetical protein